MYWSMMQITVMLACSSKISLILDTKGRLGPRRINIHPFYVFTEQVSVENLLCANHDDLLPDWISQISFHFSQSSLHMPKKQIMILMVLLNPFLTLIINSCVGRNLRQLPRFLPSVHTLYKLLPLTVSRINVNNKISLSWLGYIM